MKYDELINKSRETSLDIIGDAEYEEYELWLGSFEGENFKWKVIEKYNNFSKAFDAYKKFCDKQMSYSQEELRKVWSSPRLDVELRQGKRLLNWLGIYSRKVEKDLEEEEEEEKAKSHKGEASPKKDSEGRIGMIIPRWNPFLKKFDGEIKVIGDDPNSAFARVELYLNGKMITAGRMPKSKLEEEIRLSQEHIKEKR